MIEHLNLRHKCWGQKDKEDIFPAVMDLAVSGRSLFHQNHWILASLDIQDNYQSNFNTAPCQATTPQIPSFQIVSRSFPAFVTFTVFCPCSASNICVVLNPRVLMRSVQSTLIHSAIYLEHPFNTYQVSGKYEYDRNSSLQEIHILMKVLE